MFHEMLDSVSTPSLHSRWNRPDAGSRPGNLAHHILERNDPRPPAGCRSLRTYIPPFSAQKRSPRTQCGSIAPLDELIEKAKARPDEREPDGTTEAVRYFEHTKKVVSVRPRPSLPGTTDVRVGTSSKTKRSDSRCTTCR